MLGFTVAKLMLFGQRLHIHLYMSIEFSKLGL